MKKLLRLVFRKAAKRKKERERESPEPSVSASPLESCAWSVNCPRAALDPLIPTEGFGNLVFDTICSACRGLVGAFFANDLYIHSLSCLNLTSSAEACILCSLISTALEDELLQYDGSNEPLSSLGKSGYTRKPAWMSAMAPRGW